MLETAYEIYRKQGQQYDALRVALRMSNTDSITELLAECKDPLMRKQMAILLGRHPGHSNGILYRILEGSYRA